MHLVAFCEVPCFLFVTPQNFSPLVVVLGIHIILDLTPNYRGQNSWFLPAQADVVAAKMKVSFVVGGRLCGFIHSKPCVHLAWLSQARLLPPIHSLKDRPTVHNVFFLISFLTALCVCVCVFPLL